MQEAVRKTLTSRKLVLGLLAGIALAVGALWLVDPDGFPIKGPTTQAEQPGSTPAAGTDAGPALSEAERIARLQRTIDEDRKYLDSLNAQLKIPTTNTTRPRSASRRSIPTWGKPPGDPGTQGRRQGG